MLEGEEAEAVHFVDALGRAVGARVLSERPDKFNLERIPRPDPSGRPAPTPVTTLDPIPAAIEVRGLVKATGPLLPDVRHVTPNVRHDAPNVRRGAFRPVHASCPPRNG